MTKKSLTASRVGGEEGHKDDEKVDHNWKAVSSRASFCQKTPVIVVCV